MSVCREGLSMSVMTMSSGRDTVYVCGERHSMSVMTVSSGRDIVCL